MKECNICHTLKPLSDFYAHPKMKDKHHNVCKECQNSFNIYKKEKYLERKEYFVKLLGGKCQKCGYNKCLAALEFHHSDPTYKEEKISSMLTENNIEEILEEVLKCKLLCTNCHREYHYLNSKKISNPV